MSTLVGWLDDPARSIIERASAARFLAEAGRDPDACAALVRHAGDPDPLVRFWVIYSIARCTGEATRRVLRDALDDPRRVVRVRAYENLHFLEPEVEDDPSLARVRAEFRHRREEVRGDDPRGLSSAAIRDFALGRPEQAEAKLRHAVRLTWPVPRARVDLAQLLVRRGRLDAAEREIRALETRHPDAAGTRLARGLLLIAQGRHVEARPYFDRLVAEGNRTPLVLQARSIAWGGRR